MTSVLPPRPIRLVHRPSPRILEIRTPYEQKIEQLKNKLETVNQTVDHVRQDLAPHKRQRLEYDLLCLERVMRCQQPEMTEILESEALDKLTDEKDVVAQRDKKALKQMNHAITDKLHQVATVIPAEKKEAKSLSQVLSQRQEIFEALTNFEMLFGSVRSRDGN